MTKICSKCHQEKPETCFSKRIDRANGLRSACISCMAEDKKIYHATHRKEILERKKSWRDNNKEVIEGRSKAYYEANKETILNRNELYYKSHLKESAEQKKLYREINKETISACQKRYRKANKDRVNITEQRRDARKRQLPSTLTVKQWESIKDSFNNKCCYCGKEGFLSQEHFIPLSKEGEYTHNNIICACRRCNTSKCNTSFSIWYPKQPFYSKERERKILKYLNYKNDIQQLALL